MNYFFLSNPQCKKYSRLIWDKTSPYYGMKEESFFQNNRYIINSPFPLISEPGKKFTDILWPYGINPRCISSKLCNLMKKADIKGYVLYPVSIHTPTGQEVYGYSGIHIIGKRVKLDFSRSEIIEKPLFPGSDRMTKVYVNISIDFSQVNERDIFLAYSGIVVSEKLQQIFIDNNIQNIELTKLCDWELDSLIVQYIPK